VAGRSRPNTLRAVAFDLKSFFAVIDKDPLAVVPADVFEFLAISEGTAPWCGCPMASRTVGPHHRPSAVVGVGLLRVSGGPGRHVGRDEPGAEKDSPPAGAAVVSGRCRWFGSPHTAKILSPGDVDALVGALRTHRDRAMVFAMVLGGLRRCEVLGLRLSDIQVAERSVFVAEGKGGHQRVVPISNTFFAELGEYLVNERPKDASTNRVFVTLKA